jgi:hypothetical protein
MPSNLDLIKTMLTPLLEPGEPVLGAMIANPKGSATSRAGGAAGLIGHAQTGKVFANAKQVGLLLHTPMALVITNRRVLTVKIKISATGAVSEVKEILSAVPLSEIESMQVKRFGLGGILTITASGAGPIKLECRVGLARELVESFENSR